MGEAVRKKLAARAALEIKNGMLVNLGIGIPSLVPDFLPKDHTIMFQVENGIVGVGPSPQSTKEDGNLVNAAGYPVTIRSGASYCDSAMAFGIIRRGHVDITILGALQVSENGDLANWIVPGKKVPGMGGAMELAAKAKKVIVLMTHFDKNGHSKLVSKCTLPLTARGCVDMVITELGVFKVTKQGLILTDVFAPFTIEEIKKRTSATFTVSRKLRMIDLLGSDLII